MNEKSKQLRQQWLLDSREALNNPSVRNDVGLFSQNAGDIFGYNIFLGMLAWREASNPTRLFSQAIDDIILFRNDLLSRGMTISKLPLSTATIIASLIGRQSEFKLECQLDRAGDIFLDCILGRRLQGCPDDAGVSLGIMHLSKLNRQELAVLSYTTYFELIDLDEASIETRSKISEAESNFMARRGDKFYSGGPDIEGGGRYNDLVIDYRLSAIMKYRGISWPSIHSWRW